MKTETFLDTQSIKSLTRLFCFELDIKDSEDDSPQRFCGNLIITSSWTNINTNLSFTELQAETRWMYHLYQPSSDKPRGRIKHEKEDRVHNSISSRRCFVFNILWPPRCGWEIILVQRRVSVFKVILIHHWLSLMPMFKQLLKAEFDRLVFVKIIFPTKIPAPNVRHHNS